MTEPTLLSADAVSGPPASHAGALARGGAANLVGALVYGASGFVLLVILNRGLGVAEAGVVVVAIAVFNIVSVVCALGASTGIVRTVSRLLALDQPERIPPTLAVALVPVAVLSVLAAGGLWLGAGLLTGVIASGSRTGEATSVVRSMAPFLPFATLHYVLIQGTRGFGTMFPLVAIERIGRSLALPALVGIAALTGAGPRGAGVAWAASNVVALCLSAWTMRSRVRAALAGAGRVAAPLDRRTAGEFWGFTAPRAVGQTSDVAINWFDTILIGALIGTTPAGIYASGTRYLQPGLFAAEALMQVSGPRVSALLATGDHEEASRLAQVVGGWQTVVVWPVYLLVAVFPSPLLSIFGPEVVAARGAVVWLAVAMLVVAPLGPSGAVILMGGRSRQAMVNTLLTLAINVAGNLLLVERYGITAAGAVWAVTIVVSLTLPTWQSYRTLNVTTAGRPSLTAAALAAGTVGVAAAGTRVLLGDRPLGLVVAVSLGGALYLAGLWKLRTPLHLDIWWAGVRRNPTPAGTAARGTP
ncbi:MAG: multi antimicrobial extrusion protein MatE [Acidimicrobiales bacterium]|nr:multi antimicrobial extrusion protein MatE [Acidimicrobiales bacterium]